MEAGELSRTTSDRAGRVLDVEEPVHGDLVELADQHRKQRQLLQVSQCGLIHRTHKGRSRDAVKPAPQTPVSSRAAVHATTAPPAAPSRASNCSVPAGPPVRLD